MWNRKELKEKAKAGVKRNYWKTVLVALIFSMIVGSIGAVGGIGSSFGSNGIDIDFNSFFELVPGPILAFIGIVIVAAILFLIFASIALVNPFSVGIYKYNLNAVRGNGNISDLGNGFDVSYKRNVKVMFLADLYIFLWMLLFIIPGFIKAYEYRMIPYLLAENPEMDKEEAFITSKAMMKGNKWRAFVLDLSFILWEFLGTITLGIVGVLWVSPYKLLTDAALYDALKENN